MSSSYTYYIIAVLSCAGFMLTSCRTDRRSTEQLLRAEQLVVSHPDSALHILRQMEVSALSRRSAAHRALLCTEALQNSGQPMSDDSLISSAWDYYEDHSHEADKRYRTLYYWGCIKWQQNSRQEALRLFLQAEEVLEEHPDPRYLGLVYLYIARLYYDEADYRQANRYFEESRQCLRQVSDTLGEAQALAGLGAVANKMAQVKTAIRYYTEAFDLADDIPGVALAHQCLHRLIPLYFILDQEVPRELMQCMETFARKSGDHLLLDIQLLRHHADSARHYLQRMESSIEDTQDRMDYHYAGYWVEVYADNTHEATRHLRRYLQLRDSVARRSYQASVGEISQDYFEERLRFAEYKMYNRTLWMVVGICAVLLLALGIWMDKRRKMRLFRVESDSYLQAAGEAKKAYQALCEQNNRNQNHLKELTANRFRTIERIGRAYYEQENTSRQKESIFQEVKRLIDGISTDEEIRRELELVVDSTCQNAMQKLGESFPTLKESDRRLLCYIFCGFSPQIISLFTHETIENVYARKSRLKSRVKASDSPHRDFLLELFK